MIGQVNGIREEVSRLVEECQKDQASILGSLYMRELYNPRKSESERCIKSLSRMFIGSKKEGGL